MLPSKNRLTKKKDFERILGKGKGVQTDFLFMKWVFNDLKSSRFGFIVSKKVSKKAPVRNKIKRKLREIIKSRLLKIKKKVDCIFIVRSGLERKDFHKLEEIVDRVLIKAKFFK